MSASVYAAQVLRGAEEFERYYGAKIRKAEIDAARGSQKAKDDLRFYSRKRPGLGYVPVMVYGDLFEMPWYYSETERNRKMTAEDLGL